MKPEKRRHALGQQLLAFRARVSFRGGVVDPRLSDPYVLPEGGQGAVPGLVGDCPVRGPPEVGVGHEAGPKAVGGVVGGVEADPGNSRLDQHVDRRGVQRARASPVTGRYCHPQGKGVAPSTSRKGACGSAFALSGAVPGHDLVLDTGHHRCPDGRGQCAPALISASGGRLGARSSTNRSYPALSLGRGETGGHGRLRRYSGRS